MNLKLSSNWLKWDLTLQHATSSVPSFPTLELPRVSFPHAQHTRTPMYRRRFKKKQETTFPDTIEGFGYVVKENGEIRHKDKDEKYEFEHIPKDRPYNEARYNAFINLVGDLVEQELQSAPLNFQKIIIPVNANPSTEPHTYIYMTPNAMTTSDKLLCLIPGNNTRIGQWSKRVMCDDNINSGSMVDVSLQALKKGYEVMILNPNGIYWYDNRAREAPPLTHMNFSMVPENEGPEAHCLYVFQHFISKCKAERIAIFTLGWGGHTLTELLNHDGDFFKKRVRAVAMADSTHSSDLLKGDDKRAWMRNHVVNWAVSSEPRGQPITDNRFGCDCLSSELEISDYTLPTCLDAMWKFIDVQMGDAEPEEVDDEITRPELLDEQEAELEEHLNVVSIG
ncbi:protein fam172b-like isoform 1 [Lichtheimia corymbifera JMRC:FSU:9682]|uniref:Protein fam172b-like isoform 1 n=1 Tax=Lichtheimia corymbifera JMRC:FSU:9682 TaxID=1263082 RepID=A0A068RWM3_9FUNG|nr:protein fam172b-like isoform 1 [Lichtheimia corymbifera JMRC:FSU:9682]